MHPDYFHNPPNFLPPPPPPPHPPRPRVEKKSYYLILFIHSKNFDLKGQAIVYRRKTLDMLFDLIGDIDEQYYHTLYDNSDLTFLDQETRDIDLHFRIFYTDKIYEIVKKYIDMNGYTFRYDWLDIPNTNYPNQFHLHPFPYPHKHHPHLRPRQKLPGMPPIPSDCINLQHNLNNLIGLFFNGRCPELEWDD